MVLDKNLNYFRYGYMEFLNAYNLLSDRSIQRLYAMNNTCHVFDGMLWKLIPNDFS